MVVAGCRAAANGLVGVVTAIAGLVKSVLFLMLNSTPSSVVHWLSWATVVK